MNGLTSAFWAVVDVSWRASWLVLVIVALRVALRGKIPARVMFLAWIAVSVRLLLPFSLPTTWSPFNFAPNFLHATPLTPGENSALSIQLTSAAAVGPNDLAAGVRVTNQSLASPKISSVHWAALVWAAGALVLALARGWTWVRFTRALRRSRSDANLPLASQLPARGRGRIRVSITPLVAAPALHGIIWPELLFPPGFVEKLSASELEHVVAHELAHLERRDLAAQVLIHCAAIIHWFNPLVWVAVRLARADCEVACDESVIRRFADGEREAYGSTLLKIVRLTRCGPPPPLGLGVVESKHHLKRRIQMIVSQPSSPLLRAMLASALFSIVTGLSLTAETRAQPIPEPVKPVSDSQRRVLKAMEPSQWKFAYNSTTDGLDTRFPTGVVATVGDKSISVEDVRLQMKPLVPLLQIDSHDQAEFDLRMSMMQKSVIKDAVAQILYVKEFRVARPGDDPKSIPTQYVDTEISDRISERFDNDRAKFLEYLRGRGITITDYRREIEEDIIVHYMRAQERKLNPQTAGKNPAPTENKPLVRLRVIQFQRSADTTDAALLEKANGVVARFKAGESFAALAQELDESSRRSKGGDWGWVEAGSLKPAFSEKIFALKKGELTEPIVNGDGCFIAFAEDRK